MFSRLPRRFATVALSLGLAAGAAAVAVTPAHAATTSSAASSAASGPAPVCWPAPKVCVPQTWWVPTSVITNDGLLQLLPTAVEANTTAKSTQMTQTVTVTGTLTASVSGKIPVAPPGIADVTPGGSASISGSDAEQGFVQIPAHGVGYLKFGIVYEKIRGIAYFRNVNGKVTSAPEVATVPVGFGYVASTAKIKSGGGTTAARKVKAVIVRK